MSPNRPPADREKNPRAAPTVPDPAAAGAALVQAAQAWTSLVDDWWRRQSAALPPELERAMSATLDQSKALVDMAFAQAATAVTGSAAPADGSSPAGEFGIWQPVIDACHACEAGLVGGGADDPPRSGPAREYQSAAKAYLEEFAQINREVARRLQARIASSPPADFRQLHALVVEEAENAYLDRVSTDRFAALQAAYINAMFRLRRETGGAGPGESS